MRAAPTLVLSVALAGCVGTGLSGPGETRVTGTLTAEGIECVAMQGDDGQLYTLAGNTMPFQPGDRVAVEGRIAEVSFCMQGVTIEVSAIAPA
jgi:hypothetical protein